MTSGDPPPAARPAGYDDEQPYRDADLAEYPKWWRRNVELFRRHGLRPYRPPRFADGTLATPVVAELEDELDVDVQFKGVDDGEAVQWGIWVDGELLEPVVHRRESEGYTVYDVSAAEFRSVVRDAVGD